MKLIVGLGNPGEKYSSTRHNVGFIALDALARRKVPNSKFQMTNKFEAEVIQTAEYILVKPQTFMNESGRSVAKLANFYKISLTDVYVVHDDLDIPLGKYKIQYGKGPQIHNGLLSIEEQLGSDQFWNVRVGVENREVRGNKGVPGVVYSLQNFSSAEQVQMDAVVDQVVADLLTRIG